MAPLPPLFPCAWAVAHGEDRYGLWQAFEVAGVRQVMRWVPPGRFTMGSPVTEAERGGDETQHAVTLTAGFWLADSACSQALWAAVMDGANRSHFNHDPQNPVEQVSWHDAVGEFLPGLNSRVPGLAAGLPTEPRHADAAEGEGWLMGLVVDANRQTIGAFNPVRKGFGAAGSAMRLRLKSANFMTPPRPAHRPSRAARFRTRPPCR